jgi:RNA polymerase sigma-70 factor (ECF subfamily)
LCNEESILQQLERLEQSEEEWLALAQGGDADAFSHIVELYQRPVYNLCYRMLGNSQEAEDAAQEAFLRAFRAIKRYDPKRKFASWLLSIAANYCIDQHRKKRATLLDVEAVAPADLIENMPGVERQVLAQEASEEIQTLLADLSPLDRAAIVLHYWHDYSYVEIADELQLSESAVKSRLHRARKSLAFAWQAQSANSGVMERRQHEAATV